ncbi:MAG: hypothetical protein PUK86_12040 [bacterium]|nr:hypothetical protein [bacterium]
MIDKLLHDRCLPEILNGKPWPERRAELLTLFQDQIYGYTPAAPGQVTGKIVHVTDPAYAHKAMDEEIELTWDTPNGPFTLPIRFIYPRTGTPCPAFVLINFRPDSPDRYWPVEELVDNGYAVARVYYNDVTDDSAKMDGLAAMYPAEGNHAWGKIGMWAFACSRVLDYLLTRPEVVDPTRVAVTGHSRLGKTALWAGAQDERFALAISNDSGCSGAAITRDKVGETVRDITRNFPYWFCPAYLRYIDNEHAMPFDQHELVALMAPRRVYVASAEEDTWADPTSEYLSCCAASAAYEALGMKGFVHPDSLPEMNQPLHEGEIGYHVRTGSHFFSRTDWLFHMAYRKKHNV